MSVIPISSLSSSDLAKLGYNVRPTAIRDRLNLAAVNRSLAAHAERVATLFTPECHQNGRGRGMKKEHAVAHA